MTCDCLSLILWGHGTLRCFTAWVRAFLPCHGVFTFCCGRGNFCGRLKSPWGFYPFSHGVFYLAVGVLPFCGGFCNCCGVILYCGHFHL
jgi:hypothetical protein